MPVKETCALGFDLLPREDYHKQHDRLCNALGSDFKSTCCAIRRNQELFLEHQQKCINRFDPDLQLAMERAGDIIRELAKCGCSGFCDYGYVMEKMRRLHNILDETQPGSLRQRMSGVPFKLPQTV